MNTWRKIIYVLLFILLVAQPHLVATHISFAYAAYLQSLMTIVILIVAYSLYWLHERDIETKEAERLVLTDRLADSYRYIGEVNLQLPLLKTLTTDIVKKATKSKKQKKEVFEYLLNIGTVSVAKANWGVLRFVDISTGNTIKEFQHKEDGTTDNATGISNKELISIKYSENQKHDLHDFAVFTTSDPASNYRAYLIISKDNNITKNQFPILQCILDQSQIFFCYQGK